MQTWSLLRFLQDLLLRLLLVFLAISFCSFFALDRPILRELFEITARTRNFVLHIWHYWEPVAGKVGNAYVRSMILLLSALALGLLLGVSFGVIAGTHPHSLLGRIVSTISYLGLLTPSFLLGLVVVVAFQSSPEFSFNLSHPWLLHGTQRTFKT